MQRKATSVYVPLHQLVLLFPLFLLCGSVFFDWLAIAMGSAAFAVVAFYLIAGGLIGGVIAVPFGLIDWFSMPTARPAPGVARFLAGANVMALMLFAGSWVLREPAPLSPPWQAYALAWAGALASLLTAWLGETCRAVAVPSSVAPTALHRVITHVASWPGNHRRWGGSKCQRTSNDGWYETVMLWMQQKLGGFMPRCGDDVAW
ncbi:DUF2231 domain-containing protein [Roseateles chitinivorans]|uniref:DUF2231 domain-containing protein n=1 Tax=Roseateles chitinivorans TaxID=2917965 RepID=UPI003D67862E